MIKKILVPTRGGQNEENVFATALSVARPLAAHLEFYHVQFSACEAAARTPHVDFCMGPAMADALEQAHQREAARTAGAIERFEAFCLANAVPIVAVPAQWARDRTSAHFEQETDIADSQLISHARHSDLIVLGRSNGLGVLPTNLIEMLLMGTGRPVVIANRVPSGRLDHTIVIGWQESAEAARSLGTAVPLLERARRVVLVHVADSRERAIRTLEEVKYQLAWHGVNAEVCVTPGKPKEAAHRLLQTTTALGADLLVIGGFGRGPAREALFGGVTHSIIEHADCPVFLMH